MLLSQVGYNEVGQLKNQYLHSINGGANFLQTIDYRYNPRGWLSSINNANLNGDGGFTNDDTNDKFGEELSYDDAATAPPQYNGNIASVKWKLGAHSIGGSPVTPLKQTYDYGYDQLNRLRTAVSTTATGSPNKDNLYGENVTYDNMGNITGLGRYDNIGGQTQIDTLTYTYSHYKVTQVDDASPYTGAAGFQDGVKVANEYTYDGNGNELQDLNKKISSITYNLLNLPQTITKTDGTTVTYVYSAGGNKLRKLLTAGGTTTITEYDNGIQYDNSTSNIAFIQTEEGRARRSGYKYLYEYDLKDHLGNTRVTLTPDLTDGTQQTAKILQENDYYAFGYGIQSMQPTVSPKNEYLYNHKELQEETGLYDYGARFYDPVIGRWGSVDPLAEQMRRYSPYNYGDDNPIGKIDPDGMAPNGCCGVIKDFISGAIHSVLQDNTPANVPNAPHTNNTSYALGQITGHVIALVQSNEELGAGGTTAAAGVVAAPESGGLSLTASALGVGVMAHGAWVGKNAMVNMVSDIGTYSHQPAQEPLSTVPDGQSGAGEPKPDDEAKGNAHTQLGSAEGRNGDYNQAREFDANGKPVRDIDFTDHGRPSNHPNPHQHLYLANPTGGTLQRSKVAQPINFYDYLNKTWNGGK